MALKNLSEKLDQISGHELGFEFDENVVWSKLDQRMKNRKVYIWWLVAACLLVGLTVLPISLMETTIAESPALSNHIEANHIEGEIEEAISIEPKNVSEVNQKSVVEEFETPVRKGIMLTQVAEISNLKLVLEPITIPQKKEIDKSVFAAEDISIIQASLEQPSIEKGKRITVRAQLQSFPQVVQTDQKVLKIKLYEKH